MNTPTNPEHFYIMDKVQTPQGEGTITEFTKGQKEVKVWVSKIKCFCWFLNQELQQYGNKNN